MAARATPEEVFFTRQKVATQEPIPIINLETTPAAITSLTVDPNLIIIGIIAIVGLIGLFALLGSKK